MGYTHYWNQKRDFTKSEWDIIAQGARVIIDHAKTDGIVIKGGIGEEDPKINNTLIWLNGSAQAGLDHETFWLNKKKGDKKPYEDEAEYNERGAFSFCKTQHKPYDKVVVSILALAKRTAPDAIEISSDGGDEAFLDYYGVQKETK